tara:strand:- start:31140 stop:32540 length:1401 start_codon:yes stop_codon:yes gene_type:complete
VDRCLYLAQLSDIVQRLNGIFLDAGLVTTRAFLPEQKLADGKLIVRIIVGRISGFQSETLTPRQLDWAVPAQPGDLLNLRDIEQGLDQLNRLQSNQATIQMLPGALPGESVVRIESVRSSRYGARLSLTGNDIADGDDYRGRVDLRADDLAGINDSLSLNFNQALAESDTAASYGYGFDYALPYGYSTFSLSGSRFEYDNTANGAVRTFEVSGDSTTLSANANHTLFRNRSFKIDASFSLSSKESENFIEDSRIDVSSRKLTVARAALDTKQFIGTDITAFYSVAAERGLEWLGADKDEHSAFSDRAQFRKYAASARVSKPKWQWVWSLGTQAQYSPDLLPTSEQIIVASSGLLTGFSNVSLAGSRGVWARIDTSSPWWALGTPKLQSSLRFSLLKGWVPHTSDQAQGYGSASAIGVSASLASPLASALSLQMSVGKVVDRPSRRSGVQEDQSDSPDAAITLSYTL